jgi:hypothetical protein
VFRARILRILVELFSLLLLRLLPTMTKTAGSSDLRQRTRPRNTESEKADKQREREMKKRKIEAELHEEKNKAKNKANGWFPVAAPEPDADQPEPPPLEKRDSDDDDSNDDSGNDSDDNDNLHVDVAAPGLLPSTTASVQEYNITAELDVKEDDNFEDAEEEIDTSTVMGVCLLAIQKRIRKEISDKNMSSKDKWLHKLLKDDECLIEVKRAKSICKKSSITFSVECRCWAGIRGRSRDEN